MGGNAVTPINGEWVSRDIGQTMGGAKLGVIARLEVKLPDAVALTCRNTNSSACL